MDLCKFEGMTAPTKEVQGLCRWQAGDLGCRYGVSEGTPMLIISRDKHR